MGLPFATLVGYVFSSWHCCFHTGEAPSKFETLHGRSCNYDARATLHRFQRLKWMTFCNGGASRGGTNLCRLSPSVCITAHVLHLKACTQIQPQGWSIAINKGGCSNDPVYTPRQGSGLTSLYVSLIRREPGRAVVYGGGGVEKT